ncbi:MAG: dipeptide epimerase, partial [Roseovarius gahaiensis]
MDISVTRDVFRLAQVFTISRGSRSEAQVLTVRISDGGVTGWGECVPYARYDETLDSVTAQIENLPARFDRAELQGLLPAGAARNAVDCALWDIEAKRSGKRVWDLAGLPVPGPEITAYTLSLDRPEKMRAQAALNAHRPLLKIKLGTPDDMPRVEAVRA